VCMCVCVRACVRAIWKLRTFIFFPLLLRLFLIFFSRSQLYLSPS